LTPQFTTLPDPGCTGKGGETGTGAKTGEQEVVIKYSNSRSREKRMEEIEKLDSLFQSQQDTSTNHPKI